MERKIKLLLTAVAMLFGVSQVYANGDFIVDGMAYEVNEDGVSVTLVWKDLNEPYSGDVVVPASVTFEDKTYTVNQIGYLAFSHVTRLVNGSWTVIKENTSISSVTLPNTITSIGNAGFLSCESLTKIEIPSSVLTIGPSAFSGCINLSEINLPEELYSIGSYAFSGCSSLKSIVIPAGVAKIGTYAFNGCTGLESVYAYVNDVFATGSKAFQGCNNAVLYTRDELLDAFSTTDNWTVFSQKQGMVALTVACGNGGSVQMGGFTYSATIASAFASKEADGDVTFTPDEGWELSMVKLNGEDVTAQVNNNRLTTGVPAQSTLLVTFCPTGYDVNHDGSVDISDVVALVNFILGN